MMKFTQLLVAKLGWSSGLGTLNSSLCSLSASHWTLGIQAGIGLLLGSLRNWLPSAIATERRSSYFQESRDMSSSRRGQDFVMVVNKKEVKLSWGPEANRHLAQSSGENNLEPTQIHSSTPQDLKGTSVRFDWPEKAWRPRLPRVKRALWSTW